MLLCGRCSQYLFHFPENIDVMLYEHHSASIHVCGGFSIHHKEYSNKTGEEGRYYQDFSIVDEPTDITRTSETTSTHSATKIPPLNRYLPWALQTIHSSWIKSLPNEKHSMMCRFIERYFGSLTGIAYMAEVPHSALLKYGWPATRIRRYPSTRAVR